MTNESASWGRAIVGGIIGAAVMSILLWIAQAIGLTDFGFARLLGAFVFRGTGTWPWVLGFCFHLILGAGFGIVYGFILELWGKSGWWRGLIVALPHLLLAGIILQLVHPRTIEWPGFMGLHEGIATLIIWVVIHLVYGAIVGSVYHVRLHRPGFYGMDQTVSA